MSVSALLSTDALTVTHHSVSVEQSSCDRQFSSDGVTTFGVWDYVVFAIVLCISLSIGLYHAFAGGRQRSTAEFLFADRSMSAFPVALSVFASFFSASTILGTPAEVFQQGTMYWMCVWGAIFAPLVGAFIFGPFFHKMGMLSVFEYLEARFESRSVRMLGALLFIIKSTLGMGIVLFGPSVALAAVTGFPVWATIVAVGVVCAFYTTLGGMKAVIWTDVFQTGIMLAGLLAAIIQGAIEVGGLENAWQIANKGGRIEFFDFNPDPTIRHTFWTLVIGNFFVWLPPYTVDQQMMQRFSSTKSLKQATIALLINVPCIFVMITLCSLLGVIMYAYYAQCDPLLSKRIDDPNQLVPRMVMDMFGFAPGVPGLFTASLFCAALSSVSSMINSVAAVIWQDFVRLCVIRGMHGKPISDKLSTAINKIIGVIYAAVGIGMAFLFSNVGGTVLQMSLAFNGATGAPMVGLFVLGVFFPWVNWIGALAGGILGFSFPMWLSIGTYVTKPSVLKSMVRSVECCGTTNITSSMTTFFDDVTTICTTAATTTPKEISGIDELYTLSYLWYTATGIMITVVVGVIVSFLTGYVRPSQVNSQLMLPYVDTLWCCLPESIKSRCRCGIDFELVADSDEKCGEWDRVDSNNKDEEIFIDGQLASSDAKCNSNDVILDSSDVTSSDNSTSEKDPDILRTDTGNDDVTVVRRPSVNSSDSTQF